MAIGVSATFLEAIQKDGAHPTVAVTIDVSGSTAYKFCSTPDCVISTTQGGDYVPIVNGVAPLSGKIDLLKRNYSGGKMFVRFLDEGTNSHIRDIVSGNYLKNKRITIEVGEADLAYSDYEPFFKGLIKDIIPGKNALEIKCVDVIGDIRDRKVLQKEYVNKHPLEVISDVIQTDLGYSSDFVDSTSFDPDTYTSSISHWAVSRGKHGTRNAFIAGAEEDTKSLIDDLSSILYGGVFVAEDGKLTFGRYDSSATAAADWTNDQVSSVTQKSSFDYLFNRVIFEHFYSSSEDGSDGSYGRFMYHGDTDSQANYTYPGESLQINTHKIQTRFVNSIAKLTSDIPASSATTFDLEVGNIDSFCGMRDDGSSGWSLSASRPAYFMLMDTFGDVDPDANYEVIKVTSASLDSTVTNEDGNTVKATFTIASSGRDIFGGGASTGLAWDGDSETSFAIDVTIGYEMVKAFLQRHTNGVPVIELRTGLDQFDVQLMDLVTLDNDIALAYGLDGSTGSTKWEVIGKEVDWLSDSKGIKWTLARATNTTGYTEEWSPLTTDTVINNPTDRIPWIDIRDIFVPDMFPPDFGTKVDTGLDIDILSGTTHFGQSGPFVMPTKSVSLAASKDISISVDAISGKITQRTATSGTGAPDVAVTESRIAIAETGASTVSTLTRAKINGGGFFTPELNSNESSMGYNLNFNAAKRLDRMPPGWRIDKESTSGANTWTFGTDFALDTTTTRSGGVSFKFISGTPTAGDPEINSDLIPVEPGKWYEFACWWQADSTSASNTLSMQVEWIAADGYTVITQDSFFAKAATATNTWQKDVGYACAANTTDSDSADAAFARILLVKNNTAFNAYVDSCSMKPHHPVFDAYKTSNSTGLTKASEQVSGFTTVTDTVSGWNSGSDTWVVPTGGAGRYLLAGSVQVDTLDAGTNIRAYIKAGSGTPSEIASGCRVIVHTSNDTYNLPVAAKITDLADGDGVQLWVGKVGADASWDIQGGADGRTYLTILRIGDTSL